MGSVGNFFLFHTRSLLSINVSPGLEGLPVPVFGRVEREEKFGCLIRSGRRKYSPINVQKQILRASGSSIRPIGIVIIINGISLVSQDTPEVM